MELDLISHRHLRHTIVLVYGDNVNGADDIKQKTNMAGCSLVQVFSFIKILLVLFLIKSHF